MSIIYFKILWQNKTSNPTNSRIFTTAVFVSDGKFQSTSCVSAFEFPCSGKGEAYTAKDKLTLTGLFSSPLEGRPKRTCRGGGEAVPRALHGRVERGWGSWTQTSQIPAYCGARRGGPLQAPSPSLTGLQAGRIQHYPSLALMEFQGQWPVINISPKLSVSEAPCPEDFFFFLKSQVA